MSEADQILAGKPETVGAMLAWRVAQSPDAIAFRFPDADEEWQSLTWSQTQRRVAELGAGLLSLGLGHEERVAIASTTRIEWILLDLALNLVGGVTTAIYPNTVGDDFDYIVNHSGAVMLAAENSEQADKLAHNPEVTAGVRRIILFDGSGDGERVLTLEQVRARGEAALAAEQDLIERTQAGISSLTLATLVYTSGTTGQPKGVELLHRNWVYEGFSVRSMNLIGEGALQYLWLPLSHVFGKALIACQLAIGFASAVDGRIDRIVPGLGVIKPDFMCGAPRIFEKVRSAVLLSSPRRGLKGRIARWAFAVGRSSREYRLAGRSLPPLMAARYRVADALVFSKLKQRMGGNIQFFISGSAKLSSQAQAWFYSAGLLVVEGYGLTETSAIAAVNHPRTPRFGSVGTALPGTEFRIADDGELLIRGPGVMRGYHKDPELTAEVLIDGWFHTGDIGRLEPDGYLTITDRKKDLMKTSGGKYVAPAKVESVIAATVPYVSQVVAVGDGRKYISALLTIDRDNLAKWAARRGLGALSYQELTQTPELRRTIERFMETANSKLERWETVKNFAILPTEFSVDDGGVTPSLKVRRAAVAARHADIVDGLYEEEPEDQ